MTKTQNNRLFPLNGNREHLVVEITKSLETMEMWSHIHLSTPITSSIVARLAVEWFERAQKALSFIGQFEFSEKEFIADWLELLKTASRAGDDLMSLIERYGLGSSVEFKPEDIQATIEGIRTHIRCMEAQPISQGEQKLLAEMFPESAAA